MLGEGAGATNSLSLVLYWAVPSLDADYYEDPRDVHATSALRQFFDPSNPIISTTSTTTAAATASSTSSTASTASSTAHTSSTTHASSNGATASTTTASSGATEADVEAQLRGQCAAGSYRSDRLKLIPRVVDSGSSRAAKKALQSVAEGSSSSWSGVLVGKRLRQRCFCVPERRYLEVRAAATHSCKTHSLVLVMCAAQQLAITSLQHCSCSYRNASTGVRANCTCTSRTTILQLLLSFELTCTCSLHLIPTVLRTL
jgi:anti-sigma28 factor (negative regulator of flagellin synthesis)